MPFLLKYFFTSKYLKLKCYFCSLLKSFPASLLLYTGISKSPLLRSIHLVGIGFCTPSACISSQLFLNQASCCNHASTSSPTWLDRIVNIALAPSWGGIVSSSSLERTAWSFHRNATKIQEFPNSEMNDITGFSHNDLLKLNVFILTFQKKEYDAGVLGYRFIETI